MSLIAIHVLLPLKECLFRVLGLVKTKADAVPETLIAKVTPIANSLLGAQEMELVKGFLLSVPWNMTPCVVVITSPTVTLVQQQQQQFPFCSQDLAPLSVTRAARRMLTVTVVLIVDSRKDVLGLECVKTFLKSVLWSKTPCAVVTM